MPPLWISSVALGAFTSWHEQDWTWLARFGAIGVMIGTLLTLSPLFRGGIYLSNSDSFGFAGLIARAKLLPPQLKGDPRRLTLLSA